MKEDGREQGLTAKVARKITKEWARARKEAR